MRKLFLSLGLMFLVSMGYAQSPLRVGQTQLNVGLGLSDYGLPVYVGFDHAVHPDITDQSIILWEC